MKKMWNLEHIRLICACLLCLIFTEESKTEAGKYSETFCRFQDKRYQIGQRWNPYLQPYGIIPCFECRCVERGNVLCMKVKCPTLRCSNQVFEPTKCCPKCSDQLVASNITTTGKACNSSGTIYEHGEMFGIEGASKGNQPNQCWQCACSEGNVYCGLRTCPNLTCPSPVSMSYSCCQVCKDEDSLSVLGDDLIRQPAIRGARHSPPSQSESSASHPRLPTVNPQIRMGRANLRLLPNITQSFGTFVQTFLSQQKVGQVCISHGKTYSQGDTWHPVLRFHGTVECVLCTCKGTKPECKTIQCPHPYPCEQPKKIKGKCCKVCPEEIESQLADDQDYFCGEETFPVYKGILHTSEGTAQKIALGKNETSEVEIYTWITKSGIVSKSHNIMPMEEFRKLPHFHQITRTTLNKWKIFSEEAALLNQCENPDCQTELEELLKALYLEKSEQEGC